MNKPVILVDMDGPLADFDREFYERCRRAGIRLDCTMQTQTHRFADRHIPDKAQRKTARTMVNETRWFRTLPVVEGAVAGMEALAELADVWICTKPLEANRYCRDDKAAWVRNHLGTDWEQRLIIAPDKGRVFGDILLDDAPKEEWLPYATWAPVIFPAPWNRTMFQGMPRWDWKQDPKKLLRHVWWTNNVAFAGQGVAA